jgi:hypothetical protein
VSGNAGIFFTVGITSGPGGGTPSGDGGAGGALSAIQLTSTAGITLPIFLGSGGGGSSAAGGSGGDSGSMTNVSVAVPGLGTVGFFPGPAGSGPDAGGDAGAISNINFNAPGCLVTVGSGVTAGSSMTLGGKGGNISGVTGTARELTIEASGGGNITAPIGGTGGQGGSVSNVNVTVIDFARYIAAGNGGGSIFGATGGAGGSISNVVVKGTIGDFSASFGFPSQGGLIAGQGGAGLAVGQNGSITNVTADRIATVIAGRPAANAITAANAVFSIAGLVTNVLGADLDRDSIFDFTEGAPSNPGYQITPGENDTALDGLVLVRATGLTSLPTTPLLLITV